MRRFFMAAVEYGLCLLLFLAVVVGLVLLSQAPAAGAEPRQTADLAYAAVSADGTESGVLFNRKQKPDTAPAVPELDCPGGVCPRTQPVGPEAPQFEAPSASDAAPAVGEPQSPVALTPEQKQALKGVLVQVATLVLGAFLGSGAASPFMKMILEKVLAMLNAHVTPGVTPVRSRTRAAKRKAVPKKSGA